MLEDKQRVKLAARESTVILMDAAQYFSMLARLFIQTSIAFNATAHSPGARKPDPVEEALNHLRRLDAEVVHFQGNMSEIGKEMQVLMTLLNSSKKPEELKPHTTEINEEMNIEPGIGGSQISESDTSQASD